jgi:hypothetical protein
MSLICRRETELILVHGVVYDLETTNSAVRRAFSSPQTGTWDAALIAVQVFSGGDLPSDSQSCCRCSIGI